VPQNCGEPSGKISEASQNCGKLSGEIPGQISFARTFPTKFRGKSDQKHASRKNSGANRNCGAISGEILRQIDTETPFFDGFS
jgi:hypothetical protein